MRNPIPSVWIFTMRAVCLVATIAPPVFGQIPQCQTTTQVPTGDPDAVLYVDVHVNECYQRGSPPYTYPCCSSAAAIQLPAGRYLVTLEGDQCTTECGTCFYDGTGTCSWPAVLAVAWGDGNCASDSRNTDACLLIDPRSGGGPILIDHPGGMFYAWRNDNYWGDNYGLNTIKFYRAKPDLVATSLTWDWDNAGVEFYYDIQGDLDTDATAALYWANGPAWTDIPAGAEPVYAISLDRSQGTYGPSYFPVLGLAPPPADATHLVMLVDPPMPNGFVDEANEDNNVASVALPKIAVDPIALDFTDKKVLPKSAAPNRDAFEYGQFPVIRNEGASDVTISTIELAGTDAADYFVVLAGLSTLPLTLPSGGSVVVGVYFNPQTWGSAFPVAEHKKATLRVTPSVGDPVEVSLEGGQTFDEVVSPDRVIWARGSVGRPNVIVAILRPAYSYTLKEAAALGGFDHFNWWQLIVESKTLAERFGECRDRGLEQKPGLPTCGQFTDCDTFRDQSGMLPRIPFVDPAQNGGYWGLYCKSGGVWADQYPWYYDEGKNDQDYVGEHTESKDLATASTAIFRDLPTVIPVRFLTSLAFVKANGFGTLMWPLYHYEWETVPVQKSLARSYSTMSDTTEDAANLIIHGTVNPVDLTDVERQAIRESGISIPGDCDNDLWPPSINIAMETTLLWPTDHQLYRVTRRIAAIDSCDPYPQVAIDVSANEALPAQDWSVLDNGDGTYDVFLRAERSAQGNGRVYTITVTATDASGNPALETAQVTVPIPGDLDGDGDVDRDDLGMILGALNTASQGPHEPSDLDGDGKITALDARKLVTLFTRPGGATK